MGGFRLRTIVAALVLNQFAVNAVLGVMVVHCQGADGHEATEFVHADPCRESQPEIEIVDRKTVSIASLDGEGQCFDTPINSQTPLRQKIGSSTILMPSVALLWVLEIPLDLKATDPATLHYRSPDSAESLARSVILLI